MSDSSPKSALRASLLTARRARSSASLETLRAALVSVVLARAAADGWRTVAAYEPLRTEPGSVELLGGLAAAGVGVLVPITLPDRDLDWEPWPARGALGVSAVASVDAVLVPALAVSRGGVRLGRGGGSYDRALARCGPAVARVALTFDDELLDAVPADPWDEPVDAVATPSGWVALDHPNRQPRGAHRPGGGNTGVTGGD